MKGLVVVEEKRGCGYRKPAKDGVGIYLVGPETGVSCGRLPFPLGGCPVCGGGIHASRGWTWIEPRRLFRLPEESCNKKLPLAVAPALYMAGSEMRCERCPMGFCMPEGRHGLIWIGEKHYKAPQEFLAEARKMGLSRKIKTVPKNFRLGETIVYLAHRCAVQTVEHGTPLGDVQKMLPGVFSTFMPTGIDLVVADAENVPEKAEKLAEQYGARVIQVVRAPESNPAQVELPLN